MRFFLTTFALATFVVTMTALIVATPSPGSDENGNDKVEAVFDETAELRRFDSKHVLIKHIPMTHVNASFNAMCVHDECYQVRIDDCGVVKLDSGFEGLVCRSTGVISADGVYIGWSVIAYVGISTLVVLAIGGAIYWRCVRYHRH